MADKINNIFGMKVSQGVARIFPSGGHILSYSRYLLVIHGVFGESDNFSDEQRVRGGGGGGGTSL